MRTLVHLSDLHFGRVDTALLAPLRDLVRRIAPDVLVVSGDLTQRARSVQFKQARAWLDTLPEPQIIVPGNHDISLYNVFRRFVLPLDRYKRYITEDLEPLYVDDEIAVMGINTARSLTFRWQGEQGSACRDTGQEVTPSAAPHAHCRYPPPVRPANDGRRSRPNQAGADGDGCVCRVRRGCASVRTHARKPRGQHGRGYDLSEYAALVIQAGPATSTRGRGEVNSFNVVRVEHEKVEVDRYGWDVVGKAFSVVNTGCFMRSGNVWAAHMAGLYAAGL